MSLLARTPLWFAVAASAGFAFASIAADLDLTKDEALKLNKCMAMTPAVLVADAACLAVLKKAEISKTDVEKMRHCESIQENVSTNPDCMAMVKKHPQLARGHGETMNETGKE